MGRGDKKTKRGKIVLGSYGNKRRKKRTPLYVAPVKKKTAVKEAPADEVVDKKEEVVATPKAETKKAAPKKAATKKATTKKAATTDEKTTVKAKTTKKAAPKKAAAKKEDKKEDKADK